MGMPPDLGIIDTMISFPATDFSQYEFIRKQLRDSQSRDEYDFPVEYMFKNVPKELYGTENPIDVTLHEMDRFGVEIGAHRRRENEVGAEGPQGPPRSFRCPQGRCRSQPRAWQGHPTAWCASYEEFGVRSFGAFNCRLQPAGRTSTTRAHVSDLREML